MKLNIFDTQRYTSSLLAIIMACVVLSGCTGLFFQPMEEHVTAPSRFGYEYEDVYLTTQDKLRVHGWWIKTPKPAVGTLYFLHGNAENISTHFRSILWMVNQGYNAFVLDYRGYGQSQGRPGVPAVFKDIEAGSQWIAKRVQQDYRGARHPVFIYGQSLGASLALGYAAQKPDFKQRFNGLIVEAPFSRYSSIAKHVASRNWLTWAVQYPAKWVMKSKHDPIDAVSRINGTPLMVIHSADDAIIPQQFGKAVFNEANQPKYWVNASGPHISAAAKIETRRAMITFLRRFAG